ncbi:MAG TPA: hypothetical protein VHC22_19610 [Pirellulales bacterium]|nr:hypothetical protein [Pirellulales bacterium]
MTHDRRKRPERRARAALGWCLLMFITSQAALDAALDGWPEIRDPEFGSKLARLRSQLDGAGERPLILILGSSRSEVGIDPQVFDAPPNEGSPEPIVFNFAMTGAGPIQQSMLLTELLARRIVPAKVLVELHPLFLNQRAGALREETRIDVRRLGWSRMTVLCGYSQNPGFLRRNWWRCRMTPWYVYRQQLLDMCWPGWCTQPGQYRLYRHVGPSGWLPFTVSDRGEEARRERLEKARLEYQQALSDFRVTSEPDRALRELFDLCGERQIAVGVYLMPEASQFRDWYPPGLRSMVDDYLHRLQEEYAFDVFDFSTSVDDESFADGHHLLSEAAAAFSARFGREVIAATPADRTSQPSQRTANRWLPTKAATK